MDNRLFTLSKAQVMKLIRIHSDTLSGTVTSESALQIVLSENVNDKVVVQDILGNHVGYISVKEAWAL